MKKIISYEIPRYRINYDVKKIVVEDDRMVTVYTDDGFVASARCHPSDEFDEKLGYDIAYQRIKIARLEKKIQELKENKIDEEYILRNIIKNW